MKKQMQGFSLIELVIFIVVMGLALSSIFLAFTTALQKSVTVNPQTTANELATMRMNIILGQKHITGFSAFTDICPAASVCAVNPAITGYSTTSTITTYTVGSDSNYKLITVTTTGPQNAKAVLTTVVGAYL